MVLVCRQQSWVASSQGTFKRMRGAGSAFLIVRFEAGQVRVIVPMAHCLLSNSRPIRGLLRGITSSKVRRILSATVEVA